MGFKLILAFIFLCGMVYTTYTYWSILKTYLKVLIVVGEVLLFSGWLFLMNYQFDFIARNPKATYNNYQKLELVKGEDGKNDSFGGSTYKEAVKLLGEPTKRERDKYGDIDATWKISKFGSHYFNASFDDSDISRKSHSWKDKEATIKSLWIPGHTSDEPKSGQIGPDISSTGEAKKWIPEYSRELNLKTQVLNSLITSGKTSIYPQELMKMPTMNEIITKVGEGTLESTGTDSITKTENKIMTWTNNRGVECYKLDFLKGTDGQFYLNDNYSLVKM